MESKQTLTVNGGQIIINSYDDGMNATSDVTVNGGYIYSRATNNDALDANGDMYIKGGLVYAIGATNPEVALDADERHKLYIQGGTIIAVGNLESGAEISGGTCKYTTTWTENSWHALYNDNTLVVAFKTPTKSSSSGGGPGGWAPDRASQWGPGGSDDRAQKLVVYTSGKPAVESGITVTGGTEYFNGEAILEGTVSGGSDVTLTDYSSNSRW